LNYSQQRHFRSQNVVTIDDKIFSSLNFGGQKIKNTFF